MPGRHLPPDRSAGDESTLGGYMAVHARPAAFDGADGMPYSVEIVVDETAPGTFAGYLLFMRWRRLGPAGVEGHIESDYLMTRTSESEARAAVGAMSLHDVKALLDELIASRQGDTGRKWWDAMRDEGGSE